MSDNRCIRDNKLAVVYSGGRGDYRGDFNDRYSSLHSDKYIVELVELIQKHQYRRPFTQQDYEIIDDAKNNLNKYLFEKAGIEYHGLELLCIKWVPLGKYYKVIQESDEIVEIFDENDSEWRLAK